MFDILFDLVEAIADVAVDAAAEVTDSVVELVDSVDLDAKEIGLTSAEAVDMVDSGAEEIHFGYRSDLPDAESNAWTWEDTGRSDNYYDKVTGDSLTGY